MSDRIRCFVIEPTGRQRVSLRRYSKETGTGVCPVHNSYHNGEVFLREQVEVKGPEGYIESVPLEEKDHPLWPKKCDCGYVFQEDDPWQMFSNSLYENKEMGLVCTLRDAPPGAMWNSWWMADRRQGKNPTGEPGKFVGADGKCLTVKTPDGDWMVDGPANNGSGWTRSGEWPNVTATPSIFMRAPTGYHGFLTDGYLVKC